MPVEIKSISPYDHQARVLIEELDSYQRSIYPDEANHLDDLEQLAKPNVVFVGAFDGSAVVGIGAVKYLAADCEYGEVKRVFVAEARRGKGISKQIIKFLESDATARGIPVLRLETGIYQPEALGLYEALGYAQRGQFGDYPDDPHSIFMEKHIVLRN